MDGPSHRTGSPNRSSGPVPDLAFTPDVNIYEVQNNGNWYDFGFMLGVAMALGGGAGGGTASAGRYRRRGRA